jgi:hypothetical protein
LQSGAFGIVPFDPLGMKSADTQLKEIKVRHRSEI